eukprot:TRINITY_DN54_c0_g1_i1.p1 TRINITY_DN54_c0_g1~~TRINITY_DN54_c0_g1_i1.p1  ORF type:complete len:696 (+),score=280.18 TRINITY_DN54_c0_g1_i1:83-2170(+)
MPKPVFKGNQVRSSNANNNADRKLPKGSHQRTKATIKRLEMYKARTKRAPDGRVLSTPLQSREIPKARIQPDRRWFGPTRSVSQQEMDTFKKEINAVNKDPYAMLMHRNKLPMGLLTDTKSEGRMHILETESFASVFGKKSTRKKPKIMVSEVTDLAETAVQREETYAQGTDRNIKVQQDWRPARPDEIFQKGQSKRIWGELYKVIDASDVVIQVVDARDPMGTRCPHIEDYMKREKAHKHMIIVLNKCDLVPTWATARWVRVLSAEFPTLAFHASITNPFGKGSLIQLLRQFGKLHQDKKQISVGFIGYPNVGKSSIINTLRAKKVCKVAPIPGETKVWQYITLMRRIFLVDCPGVVYPSKDSETDIVLKGVVRIENIADAQDHIAEVLNRVKPVYLQRAYGIDTWEDSSDFLTQIAHKTGRLLKGGEPDLNTVAKVVLHDWQRGKIPYFVCPPFDADAPEDKKPKADGVPAVKQIFGKIEVAPGFGDESAPAGSALSTSTSVDSTPALPDEVIDWDEVYKSVKGDADLDAADETLSSGATPGPSPLKRKREDDDVDGEAEADVSPAAPVKAEDDDVVEVKTEDVSDPESDDQDEDSSEEEEQPVARKRTKGRPAESQRKQKPAKSIKSEPRHQLIGPATVTVDSDDDDVPKGPRKAPRMTTNKRKFGSNYYEGANVKNRNRNRKKKKQVKHQV